MLTLLNHYGTFSGFESLVSTEVSMRQVSTIQAGRALAVAFMAAGALAFIPSSVLPKSRLSASVARRGALRMDVGEGGQKLAKIEQLKVCGEGSAIEG